MNVAGDCDPKSYTFHAPAAAGSFPDHVVTLVAPFAAGGSTDVVARVIAAKMSGLLGQQVIVHDMDGGDTSLGASFVARAEPDGYKDHALIFWNIVLTVRCSQGHLTSMPDNFRVNWLGGR